MTRAVLFLGLAVSACGYPRPEDVPAIDAPACANCALFALDRATAYTGESVTLEGTFDGALVDMPGAPGTVATALGAHRLRVTVPPAATAGMLSASNNPLAFRRTSFALGLAHFRAHYEQVGAARPETVLVTPRSGHASVVTRGSVYVLGGVTTGMDLASVERARINADGTLGAFASAEQNLTTPRGHTAAVVLKDYIYVIGGAQGTQALASIERAAIGADGTLGSFEVVASTLVVPRYGAAVVVIGNALYVLGGNDGTGAVKSVERAVIANDGTLGPFELSTTDMQANRANHAAIVVGDSLYVLGGVGSSGALRSIERAPIESGADVTLGPFALVGMLTTPRSGLSVAIVGRALYVIGGSNTASLDSVEVAQLDATGVAGVFVTAPTNLTAPRDQATIAIAGNYLYAIGGYSTTHLASIEHAGIDLGGKLTSTSDAGVALTNMNVGHCSVVIGQYLYVIGGGDSAGSHRTVQRAPIEPDGTVGAFADAGVQLAFARIFPACAIVANYLYVFGGVATDMTILLDIERAQIHDDGSVDAFAPTGTALPSGRYGFSTLILGNNLYVIGGVDTTTKPFVEVAKIVGQGDLDPFNPSSATTSIPNLYTFGIAVIGNYVHLVDGSNGTQQQEIQSSTLAGGLLASSFTATSTLNARRDWPNLAVVGNTMYVVNGGDTQPVGLVESVALGPTGAVVSSAQVPEVVIATPRGYSSTVVLGNYVYVIGGGSTTGPTALIERCEVQ